MRTSQQLMACRDYCVVWIALAAVGLCTGALCVAAAADIVGPTDDEPHAAVIKDFVDDFAQATRRNALRASVRSNARTEGVILPAISLHPTSEGDSVVAFESVAIPECPGEQRVLLLFRVGMSDGIQWDSEHNPNGVRFSVHVNGNERFREEVAEGGWRLRAVDLTPLAGSDADIEFHTNAIDGNAAYDWALFGRPQLIEFVGETDLDRLAPETVGLALAHVKCREEAGVTLSVGDATVTASLEPGTHWLPVKFERLSEPEVVAEPAAVEVLSVAAAPYRYRLSFGSLQLSSPVVMRGTAFSAYLPVENTGEGLYEGGDGVELRWHDARGVEPLPPDVARTGMPKLQPGARGIVKWEGLRGEAVGETVLTASIGDIDRELRFIVHKGEPRLPAGRPDGPSAGVKESVGAAWVANRRSRVRILAADTTGPYAALDTWNGDAWQRVGTMYPLARVATAGGPEDESDIVTINAMRADDSALVIEAEMRAGGASWPLLITYCAVEGSARMEVRYRLTAPEAAQLAAFYGPIVLAGDGAFGARKQFAIFPGLEYLEGDEPSSSTRDLAPPLHDRRVPDVTKIATPLMAVQGDDALIGLVWQADQLWADNEKHPAARFLAPEPGSGPEYVHMSLFAPSVGEYVQENEYEASRPFDVAAGQELQLRGQLVLDHPSHYGADDIVGGPHEGALALKSMQHWFDAYGMPAPSEQPRPWDEERAMCRETYFGCLWQEEPPGWLPHSSAKDGANLFLAAPLILDFEAGVRGSIRERLQRRVAMVKQRSLEENGTYGRVHANDPFMQYFMGRVARALSAYRQMAEGMLAGREEGLWVWRPGDKQHERLGIPGTHTLGQATYPSLTVLRAARFTGDPELMERGLEAMRQMELYEVPRGASMWECPQYQPDIFASSLAIKAYCEAYRLTGDEEYLEHARYWAWTGLPFLYMWEMGDYPQMLYNSIGVIGSTFYTHSWLGLPVVWMGLDYAYALQDLAQFDDSMPWRKIAQGITTCAMWQQYTEGEYRGLFPDSWHIRDRERHPAAIHPMRIMMNEFRLRGRSLRVRWARLDGVNGPVFLNSAAEIRAVTGPPAKGQVGIELRGPEGRTAYSTIAQVPEPQGVVGAGERTQDSEQLDAAPTGWLYDGDLQAIVLKHTLGGAPVSCRVEW